VPVHLTPQATCAGAQTDRSDALTSLQAILSGEILARSGFNDKWARTLRCQKGGKPAPSIDPGRK
jgi:hypothetical protein